MLKQRFESRGQFILIACQLLLPVAGVGRGPVTEAAKLDLVAEEPGRVGFTPEAVAAAGCAHPGLWETHPSDFAGALVEPGFVELHAAPCLCLPLGAAGAGEPTSAARLCLPDHPWFARGGSGYLAEGSAAAAALYAAGRPQVAEVLGPALVCAGLLAVVTRLLLHGGSVEAELASAVHCTVREDGSLCLADGGPMLAFQAVLAALHSSWVRCLREVFRVLGILTCNSILGTDTWPFSKEKTKAAAQHGSCLSTLSRSVAHRPSFHDDWQQWALATMCWPTNRTDASCVGRMKEGALRRIMDVAVLTAASSFRMESSSRTNLLRRARAADLDLCRLPGHCDRELPSPHHVQLGGSGRPTAHVLAASVVPAERTLGGLALELLLYVDGGRSSTAKCLAAFSVGACRSLPRFPLLTWRCQFVRPGHGKAGGNGGGARPMESAASAASHYGTEVLLRCPVPSALSRRLDRTRGHPGRPEWEVYLIAETDPAWSAAAPVPLCWRSVKQLLPRNWYPAGRVWPLRGLVGCSAPMWLAHPDHGLLVQEWLAYHRMIGFDKFVVYDLDGSLAESVAGFVADGFVEYVSHWPQKLSPGACAEVHRTVLPPGQDEPAWLRYCTQTQAESHCVWNLRGRARWAMLLHSFDAYAGSSDGLHDGVGSLLARLEPQREKVAVIHVQRFDFGGKSEGSGPIPSRFRWRQRAPLLLRGGQRGALRRGRSSAYDHPGALLVNPLNTWSVFTHWARGRPGTVHLTLPPEVLRVNHYVDLLGEPRCAQAAAGGQDPPCDVFDNSSAWLGAAPLRPGAGAAPGRGPGRGAAARPRSPEPATRAAGAAAAPPSLLAVVPGHGKAARTATLLESLRRLRSEAEISFSFSCLVFVYNDSPDFLALPDTRRLQAEPGCTLELRPRGVFLEFLADEAMQCTLQQKRPRFVLLLLDDIALGSERPVHAPSMVSIMARNSLDVASPALVGTHLSYDGMRPATARQRGAVGRLATFIEWQAAFFTEQAFRVLCRMVRPDLSKTWGYDELFPGAFLADVGRPPRMGIVDAMHATHTGPWLAATTLSEAEVEVQESALLEFYAGHFNITPAPIRMRLGYLF